MDRAALEMTNGWRPWTR